MSNGLLISVIIPIYNTEEYLRKCVDSVVNQTYKNLQIILVDDGSTDGSGKICDEYAAKDNRIQVIHKLNGGHTSARTVGLEVAKGEYVSFIDSDDWVDLDMFKTLLSLSGDDMCEVLCFGCFEESNKSKVPLGNALSAGRYTGESLANAKNNILTVNFFGFTGIQGMMWSKLFRRNKCLEIIKKIPHEVTIHEDALFTYDFILSSDSVQILDYYPYHYYQRPTSIIHTAEQSIEQVQAVLRCFDKICQPYMTSHIFSQQVIYTKWRILLKKSYKVIASYYKNHLFPFCDVKTGSDVIIYGAGKLGNRMHNFIKDSDIVNEVAWLDSAYDRFDPALGIKSPEAIKEMHNYDFVVIAVLNEGVSRSIRGDLLALGVNDSKIKFITKECFDKYEEPLLK